MCGIIGFNWEDKSLARRMTETIIHRGPDDVALFTDSGLSLGMRRLSIIDLTKGIYPLTNENEDIFLIFNGEIYNFQKLKSMLEEKGHRFKTNCDGETIIHAYEEFGENFLNYLNGMFAICLYDKKKKELILARDRAGIKPLYYYFNNGHLVFASEIKSIIELSTVKREMNPDALNQYFSTRYNSGEETFFKNIFRLMPGHFIRFDLRDKNLTISRYWGLNFSEEEKLGIKGYEKKLLELLKDSVKKQLISDVPLGVFLSGGLDSSAIVALIREIRDEEKSDAPIRTYSVGFAGGEKVNETKYAKRVSELFKTEHQEFLLKSDIVKELPKIVWHCDEPLSDPALIPVYFLSEEAKKSSTVILTGDGGDELFAGYNHYKLLTMAEKAEKIPIAGKMAPRMIKMIPLPLMNKFYKHASDIGKAAYERAENTLLSIGKNKAKAYYELLSIFSEKEREELLTKEHFKKTEYETINNDFFRTKEDYLKQLQAHDFSNMLSECFLMKTDRMTMAKNIESRVPFLDHRLIELAFKMPSKYKLHGGTTKYVLKRAMNGRLPKDIIWRNKQTFHVPVENWLNNDLKSTVSEVLNITKIYRQGIMNPYFVKKTIDNYNNGKLYYSKQLWAMLTFQMWHNTFIEKN
jgi:asparagine synthase (glutamine-hydrolysing)